MKNTVRCYIRYVFLFIAVISSFLIYMHISSRYTPSKDFKYVLNTSHFSDSNHLAYFKTDPDFTSADNIAGFAYYIVPNIIHMVHFGKPELNFGEMVLIKSAFMNHKPDRLIIHCDCYNITGEYWNLVKDIKILEIMYKEKPDYVFGKKLSWIQHASDVARIQILMEYGGIYLDSDVYVVKSLNKYRKFEFTLGWPEGEYIGSQVLVAHKNARFLKLYYKSYHDYRPDLWYYNAGELPTKSILHHQPHLVHRVCKDFGVDTNLVSMLYAQQTDKWQDYVTIHLLLRHKGYMVKSDPVKEFDLENIKMYNRTFGYMARMVIFGSRSIISRNDSNVG